MIVQEYNKFSFGSISCGSYKVFLGHGILVWECPYFKCAFKNRHQFHTQRQSMDMGWRSVCFITSLSFVDMEDMDMDIWCWRMKKDSYLCFIPQVDIHVRSNAKQTLIRGVKNLHTNMCLPFFLNTLIFRNWDLIITIYFLHLFSQGAHYFPDCGEWPYHNRTRVNKLVTCWC